MGEYANHWLARLVKAKLMNKAIQDIGMGTYNWQLFAVCGFGWFADKYVESLFPIMACRC